MNGKKTDVPSYQKQTAQEYLSRQSAESVQANQKIEVLDKIRTSNMIFRGQKLLDRFRTLNQNKMFGLKPNEGVEVPLPDDVIQFDCKTEHHHHPAPDMAASLLKIGVAAVMVGAGAGLPFAIPAIISGMNGVTKPAAVGPDESTPGTVTINGREYELGLEP